MKKFTAGLLNRTKSTNGTTRSNSHNDNHGFGNAPTDSPEANAGRGVRLFCESGSMENGGEEVLHLPVIVDAAESSPAAAAAAAQQIRKFLTREWASKPYVQYNAIMLVRILSDNPGPSFTRNFDKSFVSTVKEVLRNCKDGSTQQILRETLDTLEANKQYQEGMEALITMWRKEKGQQASFAGQQHRTMPVASGWNQGYGAPRGEQRPHAPTRERSSRHNVLPAPTELASRIEEAKNSAKILLQLLQSTPSEEILDNDLIREFNERCQSAQRSMQGYISCDNPAPDDDTMLTLIETNEQLSLSSTRYQRAVLTARRAMGVSPSPGHEAMAGGLGTAMTSGAPGVPPLQRREDDQSVFPPPASSPPSGQRQQYYQQPNNMSAFASPVSSPGEEAYQAPPGPPPPRNDGRFDQSAFAPAASNESWQAPPGPPPALLNRLNSRDGTYPPPQSPPPGQQQKTLQSQSDPFADPTEYDANPAPLTITSTVAPNNTSPPIYDRLHSQSFSIDASEPVYAPSPQNLNNTSPKISRRPVSSVTPVSPSSPERQKRWPSQDAVSEIGGRSEIGRGEPAGSREARGYRY